MRHTAILWVGIGLLVLTTINSCSKTYDDAPLRSRISNVDKRITDIETRLRTYNQEIATLQELLKPGRSVKAMTQATRDGKLIGYTLEMSDNKTLFLPIGLAGQTGKGITMGVQQEPSDGKYYWRVDDQWLMNNGERVLAFDVESINGKAGFTPRLDIRDGAWQVETSPDNWQRLDYPIQGPQGDPGVVLPGLFQSINPSATTGYYELQLTDGTILHLQRELQPNLVLDIDPLTLSDEVIKKSYQIPFSIKNYLDGTEVSAASGIKVELGTMRFYDIELVWTNAEKTRGYLQLEPRQLEGTPRGSRSSTGYNIYFLRENGELIRTVNISLPFFYWS